VLSYLQLSVLEQTVWEAQGDEAFGVPCPVINSSIFILFGQYQPELMNNKLKQEDISKCLISEVNTLFYSSRSTSAQVCGNGVLLELDSCIVLIRRNVVFTG